ncbi:PP2C family protein-serine/threonine phosphatase [Peterkaempfera sp. SMS 1(5)a]|uniref:PP2C family protein-serine/threonine phosphatase n=1 Tax=Peterkaempfera podocarpi TaxID=3232308 RepID=UPI0036728EBD
MPLVMIAAAVMFDVLTPSEYSAAPLLAAACVMAGAILSRRGVIAVLVVAVLATVGVCLHQRRLGHVSGTEQIIDILIAVWIAVAVSRLLTRQESRLQAARTVAEEVQRVLLPPVPRRIADLELSARYEAAHDEARVGGDLYAAQSGPHGVRLLLGDVRGKGLGAVATVSVLLGAFREGASRERDLLSLAQWLETALERDASGEGDGSGGGQGRFTTALLVEFPPGEAVVRVLNRGHPAPYIVRGRQVDTLSAHTPDLPLGLGSLSDTRSAPVEIPFGTGSVLVMVTDGVTEARNGAGDFYDPQRGLPQLAPFGSAREAADRLIADVDRWVQGPAADDRAILTVRRLPPR